MRGFSAENREPLRNLLGGMLGRRPGELAGRELDPTLLKALEEEEGEIEDVKATTILPYELLKATIEPRPS